MRQDRLLEIVGRIYQRTETWDQSIYESRCGTKRCVAGHAQKDSGSTDPWTSARYQAEDWLDLDPAEAQYLFDENRTLPELIHFATTGKRP